MSENENEKKVDPFGPLFGILPHVNRQLASSSQESLFRFSAIFLFSTFYNNIPLFFSPPPVAVCKSSRSTARWIRFVLPTKNQNLLHSTTATANKYFQLTKKAMICLLSYKVKGQPVATPTHLLRRRQQTDRHTVPRNSFYLPLYV